MVILNALVAVFVPGRYCFSSLKSRAHKITWCIPWYYIYWFDALRMVMGCALFPPWFFSRPYLLDLSTALIICLFFIRFVLLPDLSYPNSPLRHVYYFHFWLPCWPAGIHKYIFFDMNISGISYQRWCNILILFFLLGKIGGNTGWLQVTEVNLHKSISLNYSWLKYHHTSDKHTHPTLWIFIRVPGLNIWYWF